METTKRKRFCGPCDKEVPMRQTVCKDCGADTEVTEWTEEPPKVVDLMDALRRALERVKS